MKAFTVLFPIVFILTLLAGPTFAQEDQLVLVKNGEPKATIVLAPVPPPGEMAQRMGKTMQDAAADLQLYVRKMTGATLPIVTDDRKVEGTLILIGESAYTRALDLTRSSFEDQEYLIRAQPDRLVLMGYDQPFDEHAKTRNLQVIWSMSAISPAGVFQPIGSHYAVHHFLEEFCGVRWYFPGEVGEVVPKQKDLVVPVTEIRRKPSVRMRFFAPDAMPPKYYYEPQLTKMLDDPQGYWEAAGAHYPQTFTWAWRIGLGGELFYCNHSLYGYFDRFAESHPEWFANSKPARGVMMCFSQPGLLDQVVADAREYFDKFPDEKFFPVVPMDVEKWCQCGLCKPQYTANGPTPQYSRTSNYVWGFVAKVAAELAKSNPGKGVSNVAYGSYLQPPDPDRVKLPPNVAVQICSSFAYRDDPMQRNVWTEKVFIPWSKAVPDPSNVYIWQYWLWPIGPNYNNFPNGTDPRQVAELARFLKELRFTGGIRVQIDEAHGPLWSYPVIDHIRVYMMARMMDNWDADDKQILDEYFKLFYGPAEEPMRQFWTFLFTAPNDPAKAGAIIRREVEPTPQYEWTHVCTSEDVKWLEMRFEEARKLTPAGSAYRSRVELVYDGVYREYIKRISDALK